VTTAKDQQHRRTWPIIDSQACANLRIGEMLRRYHEKHPDGLAHFRTSEAWLKIIEWQLEPGEFASQYLDLHVCGFLQQGMRKAGPPYYGLDGPNRLGPNNPWSIQYRSGGKFSINRVPTAAEDDAFQRDTREEKLVKSELRQQKEAGRLAELHRQWEASPAGQLHVETKRQEEKDRGACLVSTGHRKLKFDYPTEEDKASQWDGL
jgi:hypothetical protein